AIRAARHGNSKAFRCPGFFCRLYRRTVIPTRFRGPSRPVCSTKNGLLTTGEAGFVTNRLIFRRTAAFCFFHGSVGIFHLLSRFALPRCTTRRRFSGVVSVPSDTLAG